MPEESSSCTCSTENSSWTSSQWFTGEVSPEKPSISLSFLPDTQLLCLKIRHKCFKTGCTSVQMFRYCISLFNLKSQCNSKMTLACHTDGQNSWRKTLVGYPVRALKTNLLLLFCVWLFHSSKGSSCLLAMSVQLFVVEDQEVKKECLLFFFPFNIDKIDKCISFKEDTVSVLVRTRARDAHMCLFTGMHNWPGIYWKCLQGWGGRGNVWERAPPGHVPFLSSPESGNGPHRPVSVTIHIDTHQVTGQVFGKQTGALY